MGHLWAGPGLQFSWPVLHEGLEEKIEPCVSRCTRDLNSSNLKPVPALSGDIDRSKEIRRGYSIMAQTLLETVNCSDSVKGRSHTYRINKASRCVCTNG